MKYDVIVCKTLDIAGHNPDVFYGLAQIEAGSQEEAEAIAREKFTVHYHDDITWEGSVYDSPWTAPTKYVEGSFQVVPYDNVPVTVRQMVEEQCKGGSEDVL